jgi:FkbM family methyltransferase
MELQFQDVQNSDTLYWVVQEALIGDEYNLKTIDFEDGDVVIDIGGNVGCVSIYLAKKYPNIKIYSYEAHPVNYECLLENIRLNDVNNVIPFNYAVLNQSGSKVNITLDLGNTGSSSLYVNNEVNSFDVETISFDDIIETNNIEKIKLLKIDCEGAEYEIIEASQKLKEIEIENFSAEIHTFMVNHNKNPNSLIDLIGTFNIKNKNIKKL